VVACGAGSQSRPSAVLNAPVWLPRSIYLLCYDTHDVPVKLLLPKQWQMHIHYTYTGSLMVTDTEVTRFSSKPQNGVIYKTLSIFCKIDSYI